MVGGFLAFLLLYKNDAEVSFPLSRKQCSIC